MIFFLTVFAIFREEEEEQRAEDAFREVIVSCRSLSTYEPKSLKSALPQVSHTDNNDISNTNY